MNENTREVRKKCNETESENMGPEGERKEDKETENRMNRNV
jgi:hypothetical protein